MKRGCENQVLPLTEKLLATDSCWEMGGSILFTCWPRLLHNTPMEGHVFKGIWAANLNLVDKHKTKDKMLWLGHRDVDVGGEGKRILSRHIIGNSEKKN